MCTFGVLTAIKKEIQKTLKKMPLRERVFVLGVTSSPTDCPGKKILSVFNKIIPVPLPDLHARVGKSQRQRHEEIIIWHR